MGKASQALGGRLHRSFPEAEPYPDDLREVNAWIKRKSKHPMRVKA
jgi:hypothetical protein